MLWIVILLLLFVAAVLYARVGSEKAEKRFKTAEEAVAWWAGRYRPRSAAREYGAMLMQVDGRYALGRTYRGYAHHTIPGFVLGYLAEGLGMLRKKRRLVGFVHSHPRPQPTKDGRATYNDFPSAMDCRLLKLPGVDEVYVVPFQWEQKTPPIIRATDTRSWYYPGHEPQQR